MEKANNVIDLTSVIGSFRTIKDFVQEANAKASDLHLAMRMQLCKEDSDGVFVFTESGNLRITVLHANGGWRLLSLALDKEDANWKEWSCKMVPQYDVAQLAGDFFIPSRLCDSYSAPIGVRGTLLKGLLPAENWEND